MSSELKPLKDNLLVMLLEREKKSAGGIVIPTTAQKPVYKKGVIVELGPGLDSAKDQFNSKIPDYVKKGMIVLFPSMAGWDITYEGIKYRVVSWRQCEAIIDPENKQNESQEES